MSDSDLQFPIGGFELEAVLGAARRGEFIAQVADCPRRLGAAVSGLDRQQLDTPYRPGGWTVRQVAHHLPDSHLNVYTRFRLALTEDVPTVRTFDHDRWADLTDSRTAPIESSLDLLEGLHHRWVALMKLMAEADWERRFNHPDDGVLDLAATLQRYAWHGRHHVGHITALRNRMNW